ncbi:MAG: hypothetical protein MJH09_06910 [Cetobacterium sp.]|nr:hypothetical protein [Cetobacterium sp.]
MKRLLILFFIVVVGGLGYLFYMNEMIKPQLYTGTYTDGFEADIFTDKNSGQAYWIYGDKSIMESLKKEMNLRREKTGEPYITVNMTLEGIDRGKAKGEIAEEGDKDLEVIRIISIK